MSEEATSTETTEADSIPSESPSIFSEGLTFASGWADSIQDPEFSEVRSMASQFKDLPAVFKAFKETKGKLSERMDGFVKLPGADATEEDIAAYRAAIGVPESKDGYTLKAPDHLPEGIEFHDSMLDGFREFAHEKGIPNDLAQELINFQIQAEAAEIQSIREAQAEQAKAAQDELRKEWGSKFEANSELARRAGQTFGLSEDSPALRDPDVLRAMAKAGSLIAEDKMISTEAMSGRMSPGSEAKDISGNPDNPLYKAYWEPSHPNHQTAVATYQRKMQEQTKREGY